MQLEILILTANWLGSPSASTNIPSIGSQVPRSAKYLRMYQYMRSTTEKLIYLQKCAEDDKKHDDEEAQSQKSVLRTLE